MPASPITATTRGSARVAASMCLTSDRAPPFVRRTARGVDPASLPVRNRWPRRPCFGRPLLHRTGRGRPLRTALHRLSMVRRGRDPDGDSDRDPPAPSRTGTWQRSTARRRRSAVSAATAHDVCGRRITNSSPAYRARDRLSGGPPSASSPPNA
jgi:hypothetical protein